MQMVVLSTTIYQIMNIAAAHLSGIVSHIFPENFNTDVIPCILQFKPKAFLSFFLFQFIFHVAPKFLDGVEVWTLWGPVHNFQSFQQIPSIAGSSSNSLFYGYCKGQFNKNNSFLVQLYTFLCLQNVFSQQLIVLHSMW